MQGLLLDLLGELEDASISLHIHMNEVIVRSSSHALVEQTGHSGLLFNKLPLLRCLLLIAEIVVS